jgi:hypothetical protein
VTKQALFLIGCGVTKAAFPNAPSNDQLLRRLIESETCPTLDKYRKLCGWSGDSQIERFLTHTDLSWLGDKNYEEARRKINSEIASFFKQFRYPQCPDNAKVWLAQYAKILIANDCIVSLNYDALLEGALDTELAWHPKGGMGRVTNPLLENGDYHVNPMGISLLKIHGSEYFVESDIYKDERDRTYLAFSADPSIFPASAQYSYLSPTGVARSQPYIIAPSFIKVWHYQIVLLMLDALDAAERVEHFVIIGCGMRPEDSFLWLLLTRYTEGTTGQPRQVIIVDPNNAQSIKDQLLSYIPMKEDDVITLNGGIESSIDQLRSLLGRA